MPSRAKKLLGAVAARRWRAKFADGKLTIVECVLT